MEQEENKSKIDEIKEKSQAISAQGKEKAMKFVDHVFGWIQGISCVAAVLLACVFAIVLVYSAIYATFHGAGSNLAPTFKEFKANPENQKAMKKKEGGNTDSLDVSNAFKDEVKKICELTKANSEDVVAVIVAQDAKNRKTFVKGAVAFLEDGKKDIGKDYKAEEDGNRLMDAYVQGFYKNIKELPLREEKAKQECSDAWARVLSTLFGIVAVMILAMLIKIEKNTRKD